MQVYFVHKSWRAFGKPGIAMQLVLCMSKGGSFREALMTELVIELGVVNLNRKNKSVKRSYILVEHNCRVDAIMIPNVCLCKSTKLEVNL